MAKAPLSPVEKVFAETPSMGLPSFQFEDPEPAASERRPSGGSTAGAGTFMPLFEQAASKWNVPVNVLLALGDQESKFNPRALGQQTQWGRAKGMMQYLDSTAANLGINPYDPDQAINAAARQIRERLDKGYSMEDAVKEHFAGPDRRQWGKKTAAYGTEVMEKAGRYGEQFMAGAPSAGQPAAGQPTNPEAAAAQLQAMLDDEEPGRYIALTPDQDSRYQERSDLMFGKGLLSGATEPMKFAPSPLTVDNQQAYKDQSQPSPLTMENQNRLATGQQVKNEQPAEEGSGAGSYLKQSVISGGYALAGAGAKLLDAVNPWTFSEEEIATLYKDQPEKFRDYMDNNAGMILNRFAKAMQKNSEEAMQAVSPEAKKNYGELEYATLDTDKAAYLSPVKVIGDAVQSLPSSLALAVTAYLTRGASARAEANALAAGATQAEARQAAIAAGQQMAVRVGATGEGAMGYAQQANATAAKAAETKQADMEKSPRYRELVAGGYSPETARARVIAETAEASGTMAGVVDASVNAVGGEFLGKIIGEGGKLMPRMFKGFANEAATETVQSGGEQFGENLAMQRINPDQSLSEGVGEAMAQGAAVGGVTGAGFSGALGRGPSKPADQPQAEPTAEEAQAEQPAPEPAPAPGPAPAPAPEPAPAPSGPLGRAMQNAQQGRANESAADGKRVALLADGLEPITGAVVSESDGGMMIRGDDGQSYQITRDELSNGAVQVVDEAQLATMQQAAQQDAEPPLLTEVVDEPPTLTDVVTPGVEIPTLTDEVSPGVEIPVLDDVVEPAAKPEPEAAPEPEPEARKQPKPLEEQTEAELRARLKYLGGQARATGGWNKTLMQERRKVEKAIEAKKAEAAPVEEQPAPQVQPEQQPAAPQVEQPADQQPVKWFGSQEKAAAFIDKKKLGDTHEVVEAGRSRFEIREKAAAAPAQEQQAEPAQGPQVGQEVALGKGRVPGSVTAVNDTHVKVKLANRVEKMTREQFDRRVQDAQQDAPAPAAEQAQAEHGSDMAGPQIDSEWTRFADDSGTLNVPRAEMPQIKAEHRGAMVNFLNARGIAHEEQTVPASSLKPTQAEFSPERVGKAKDFTSGDRSILVSSDGYVLDGHHQWLAKRDQGQDVKVIRLDAPISELLPVVHEFPSSTVADGATSAAPSVAEPATRAAEPEQATQEQAAEPAQPQAQQAPEYGASNKLVTADRAAELRKRLKAKLTQLNSGIDPEILALGAELAVFHIEAGVRQFSAFARTMADDLDMPLSKIRPYLRGWYNGARDMMEDAGVSIEGMDSPDTVRAELARLNEETPNEPERLDQPSAGALEGAPAAAVQGAEGQAPARERPARSSGADAPRDERAGSQRDDDERGVGGDARAVPVPAARAEPGRAAGERSGEPVQRGDAGDAQREPGNRGGGPTGQQPSSVTPSQGVTAEQRPANFTITEADEIGQGGAKTKFKANVAAIRLLKKLEIYGRAATAQEQAVLAKYVGWGGIPQAFERSDQSASKGWEREVAELRDLLTPEEYSAAASSTKNAHYTSPEIVTAMWGAAQRLGFNGGRVLEPSVGAGNFFGLMPHELRKASALNGVELDRITSGIATQLYPEAKIARMGFQDYLIPDGHFDIAIGNPPFGRESLYDGRRKDLSGLSIHNYFFAKSIDGLRPGGVLAMVVTNRMLDVPGDRARRYMADRADFIGAIRLPNDAFMANAGTSVTTDIIFLRKRAEGAAPAGEQWMEVRDYTDKDGNTVPLNEYFHQHPEMMLGDFGAYGSMYKDGEPALVARQGQDTGAELAAAIARLPQAEVTQAAAPVQPETRATVIAEGNRVGSMFLDGDTVKVRGEDVLGENTATEVSFPSDKARERVVGMIGIRDLLTRLRGLQLDPKATDKQITAARKQLNAAYDAFTNANGPLNLDANKRLFRDDPTWPQLSALEDNFDKGLSAAVAKKTGEEPRKPSASKAAIFNKRTQQPYQAPTSASSAKDALVSSLAERGRIDLDLMSELYGKSPEAIVKELGELVYQDPVKGYVTSDEYLSGNVKAKLAQARAAAQDDAAYARNVEALEAVQPADVEAVDINVKPGAPWVPATDMADFANHIGEGKTAKAIYNPASAKWSFLNVNGSTSADQRFATGRVTLTGILEAAANQKTIQVYDAHADGSRTLNEGETQLANDKVNAVKEEWGRWIWSDDARRERLGRLYNDTYNTNVAREYDGSHLTFPGKVGDDIIGLRPHQANGVWRIVQGDTTLLDHVVGAGKTFTMIAAAMELRRMGYAKKPMFAVPNHLVGQWAADFTKLYPGAKVLAASKKDFEKENRKRLFARIATGDWDAVIVGHSSFGKVEVEPLEQAAFIEEQIADLDGSIELMRQAEGKNSRNVKDTQKRRDALREKLKKLIDSDNKDDSLYWGELGVDALFTDEAHEFKNLAFSTSMSRVAGLGTQTGSQKAADMFLKVRQVLKATGGRNVVFATGTPISNTMAEMYTMQRYLDYSNLKGQGISHFDAWARMFGEVVTDWELSPSGKYKMNSRFAKFVNMPELMQRYGSFADVVNRNDINRMLAAQGKSLPVPKVRGGKPQNVVVPRSPDQANYIGEALKDEFGNDTDDYPRGTLVWRSENLPKKAEKGSDNMLKIMGDARKAALDMRLIDPSYPDYPGSKVNVAADNILADYRKWDSVKGAQLVFIDLSTPKNAKAGEAERLRDLARRADEGDEDAIAELDKVSPDELMALDSDFSVYDDLKQKLVARGIPAEEVAFIHDAKTDLQKEELFGKVRSGRVRVLLGSTAKMGAGTNVQDRLVALHHMDAPWRPSDLEQREGRIIRQGNKLYEANPKGFEVGIYRYATKQTLDSRMWQTIEGKANFIEQVRKGATGTREIEDVAGEAANAAEMKAAASGNPLILEEMSLRQKIRKLENEEMNHQREQYRLRDSVRSARRSIEHSDKLLAELREDAKRAQPKDFAMTVDGQEFDKRKDAGEAVLAQAAEMEANGVEEAEIGNYGDFPLRLERISKERFEATLTGAGSYQSVFEIGSDPLGVSMRITNAVKDLGAAVEQVEARKARYERDIPRLEEQAAEWTKTDELAQAKQRHGYVLDQLKPKKKEQAKPDETKASIADQLQRALNDGTPVSVVVDGERFSVQPNGMYDLLASDAIELRSPEELAVMAVNEARAKVYDDLLAKRGVTIPHEKLGDIGFNRAGITKSRSNSNDPVKVKSLPMLDRILKGSYYLGRREADGIVYHYLGRRIRVDGEPVTVMATVRETPDGRITYYNHTMLNDVRTFIVEPDTPNGKTIYRRPDLQVEAMSLSAPASPERITQALTTGPMGKHIDKLMKSGRIVVHADASTVPGASAPGMQAKTMQDGTIHMVAENLTPQNAMAVLLHEMFHAGARPLVGTPRFAKLMTRLEALYQQFSRSNGRARQFFDSARNRVEGARRVLPMSDTLAVEEFGAYAIEEYESAPKALRSWVDDVVGAIKDYLFRTFGIQLGQVTPAQLRAMSLAAIRSEAQAPGASSLGGDRYSIASLPENTPSDYEVEGWFSRKLTDAMAGAKSKGQWSILSLAPMDRMVEELASNNQPAQVYMNLKRDMDAYRSKKHQQYDATSQKWLKLTATNRKAAKEMADIMHEATISQTDPAEGFKTTITKIDNQVMASQPNSEAAAEAFKKKAADEKRKIAHDELKARFDKLPASFQALYREVRDSYAAMSEELDQILMDNLGEALDIQGRKGQRDYEKAMQQIRDDGLTGQEKADAEADALKKYNTAVSKQRWNKRARMTEMRQQLESNRLAGPYFPLARFGDYFVTVRDRESGEVLSFSRFENRADQQQFAKQARRLGAVETGLLNNDAEVRGAVDPRFVTDVENILSGAEVSDAVKDQVWQRFLESMPDMSMRKNFIHRKGREGFTSDALRAFASKMFHGSHQLGRLKYGAKMKEQLEVAKDTAKASQSPERDSAVVNELLRRHEYVMNPKGGALAQRITSAAFIYHLSMSPASALVNLSQTAIVGVPIIGAQHGVARTIIALNKALAHFTAGRGRAANSSLLNQDEKKAMRAAYDAGVIDSSQSHNLAGVGETGAEYSPLRTRVMGVIAWMFHQAERLNREVTFLAAYRLAKRDGLSHDAAVDQASRLTYKVHFDYSNTNRPRVMHGDAAKVALVFRNFQINMLWRLFRDTHQVFNGDKEGRREALMQLAGITGMMAMNAGVRGTWLFGLAMAFASMFFGDDAEDEFKKAVVETLGPTAGGFLLNGVWGHALGISVSERIGMPDLWFRSPDRQLEGKDEFNYWQSQLLGAVPGIAQNMFMGAKQISEGNVYRGIETMAPKFMKDIMRASRYANEGATTLRGDPLVDRFKPTEIAAQVLGFTPAVLAEQYERNSALKNAEKRVMDQRRKLLDRFATAYRLGDTEARAKAMDEIKAFNKDNREVAISGQTITKSVRSRQKYSERTEGGVNLNPRLDRKLRDNLGPAIYR